MKTRVLIFALADVVLSGTYLMGCSKPVESDRDTEARKGKDDAT